MWWPTTVDVPAPADDDAWLARLVTDEFARLGVDVQVVGDVARRRDGSRSFSLLKLTRACRSAPGGRGDWPRIVHEEVVVLVGAAIDLTLLPDDELLAGVVAQVFPLEGMPPEARRAMTYALPVADDLLGVLVFDSGRLGVSVPDTVVARFAPGVLQRAGVTNLAAMPFGEVGWVTGPGGHAFRVAEGPTNDFASRILAMPDLLARAIPGRAFPNGVLVAVPDQFHIAVHPVDGPPAQPVMVDMAVFAHVQHGRSEHALSPHLYWWHAGRFTRISRRPTQGGIMLEPGDELGAVLHGEVR